MKDILVLNGRKRVVFTVHFLSSSYSDKKVLHWFDQIHVSNIAARNEVLTTLENTFFKV